MGTGLFPARSGMAASARTAVLPRRPLQARYPPRPCEKAMFKSLCGSGPGSAVGFGGGLDFHTDGCAQAALIAWMSGCTPRMAIIRFRL